MLLEVGSVFHRLTVKEVVKAQKGRHLATAYRCECQCGKEITSFKYDLEKGKTKSCGCLSREAITRGRPNEDITGQNFGKLTVDSFIEIRKDSKGRGRRYWKCNCECGGTIESTANQLTSGDTRSCGCLWKEVTLPKSVASAAARVRRSGLRSGKVWELNEAQTIALILGDCHYCDTPASDGVTYGLIKRHGIDRVDNTQGYIDGNVVTCCKHCNKAKSNLHVSEFLNLVEKIYNHSIKGASLG